MALGRVLVFLVVAVGGVALAGYGWTMHQNQQSDVRQAVTVEGTVESSDVEVVVINQGSEGAKSHSEVVVNYIYTYNGQTYTSESVYPGAEKELSNEQAREIANQYSSGQTVPVYVNQEDPSRSFIIEEKTSRGVFMLMGIGGLIAVLFLSAVVKEIVHGVSGG